MYFFNMHALILLRILPFYDRLKLCGIIDCIMTRHVQYS